MFTQNIIRLFKILFFLLFIGDLNAQVRLGVLAGPQSASLFESNRVPDWFTVRDYYSSRFSFHGGLLLDIPFANQSPLHFQPALMYSGKGRKFEPGNDIAADEYVKQEQFINYLDLPLNLVLKFPVGKNSRFIFGGGPQPSLMIGGKEITKVQDGLITAGTEREPEKGTEPGTYKAIDFGLNGFLGFEFGRFFVNVNYSRGLSDAYTANYSASFKNNVIGGSIGVFFGKAKEGKSRDRDKDGIPDREDGCPAEPGTAATKGCPDRDADGIADKDDSCPDTTGTTEYRGCPPPDKDKDGVIDSADKCPDVAGLLIYEGCPIPDKDNDGVNDFEDRCPTVPGLAANKGCPIADADKDGVADKEDRCPTVAGLAKYNGCPVPDSDGDGINDEQDKCPQTKGTRETQGCPVVDSELINKINSAALQVKFVAMKADLQASSYKILETVARLLKQNPNLSLVINNYTNVLNTQDENQKLAVERANNIMAYIGLQGIDWSRIKANGYASEKAPVSAAGKNPGNRTEFKVGAN